MKLEAVVIPVSDVDRAKEFYERLGWQLEADMVDGDLRLVQFTPSGRGCAVQFGTHVPGTAGLGSGPLPGRLRPRSCT
ncbi:MAG TPA: VOC family protein [Acidimicrobiales bacterium]|nr:VOC family protein [Acidimicrobiales bacterium]